MKEAVVVCAHFLSDRSFGRDRDFMQPSAGLQVASMIDKDQFNVKLHHEMWHGPLTPDDLPKPHIVFLTGLQKDFDRMRQLSYFFHRRGAVTVAGGSFCTLYPEFASKFFDVVCAGGVDSTRDVLRDFENGTLKKIYVSPQTNIGDYEVDYDILIQNGINPPFHLVEATRGCNFKCSFCSIPAEGARHTLFGLARVKKMIDASLAASPKYSLRRLFPIIFFIDNNLGNNVSYLRELCKLLKSDKRIKAWGALVTQNTLQDRDTIDLMAEAKCKLIFSGVESLDADFLNSHQKFQNLKSTTTLFDDVSYLQSKGINFAYSLLHDPRISRANDTRIILSSIVRDGRLPIPSMLSFVSPLVGTALFWDSVSKQESRASLKLRDLEGTSICYSGCLDDDDELTRFGAEVFLKPIAQTGSVYLLGSFFRNCYRLGFRPLSWYVNYRNYRRIFFFAKRRTVSTNRSYICSSDPLDPHYDTFPSDISPEDRSKYFDPIMVTDDTGKLADWLYEEQVLNQNSYL